MWRTRTLFALTIIILVSSPVYSQSKNQKRVNIPTVSFCELTSHPEKYIGKLVRTTASYIAWWESSYLYNESCIDAEHKIHHAPDCPDNDERCLHQFSLEWKKLEPYTRSKQTEIQTTYRVKGVFIGRLVGPGAYGHLDGFRYEFRIRFVERAMSIPKSVSWKGL
jgi:hypothetical protein